MHFVFLLSFAANNKRILQKNKNNKKTLLVGLLRAKTEHFFPQPEQKKFVDLIVSDPSPNCQKFDYQP